MRKNDLLIVHSGKHVHYGWKIFSSMVLFTYNTIMVLESTGESMPYYT